MLARNGRRLASGARLEKERGPPNPRKKMITCK